MRILSLTLLALSGASVISALSGTPAFDPNARQETILGDWRVAVNAAMYDKGTYAFQRGYGFLTADALFSADTEGRGELAPAETAELRAEKAVEALSTAVHLDPGNAHAWASLGWAYARLAENDLALDALRQSWALAPHNRVLADTRLVLVGLLTTPDLTTIALSSDDIQSTKEDAAVMEHFDSRGLQFHIESMAHLEKILEGPQI